MAPEVCFHQSFLDIALSGGKSSDEKKPFRDEMWERTEDENTTFLLLDG